MLLYLFFDSLLSTCLKKIETSKWLKALTLPYCDNPHSTVILKEYFENIPLKSCKNIYKAVRKVSKILQKPCNVRSKHYKWNIAAILIFHFNIAVM